MRAELSGNNISWNWKRKEEIMKQLMKLMMVLILVCLAACAKQPEDQKEAETRTDDIYIIYTSDVHCGVSDNLGFAKLKALVNDTKSEHEYVALADCGDYLQGGTYGTVSRGSIIAELMADMEYDVITLGNHEFDYGTERLGELMHVLPQITVCNVNYTGKKENIFKDTPAYFMKDFGGTKVAFIGILTPSVLVSSTPSYFMEDGEFVFDFYNSDDGIRLAEQVQKTVDEARCKGARYVIALSHLGSTIEDSPNDSVSLIHHTRGIDAVLDGHSHSVIIGDRYPNADGEDVILSSVGTKMANVGELIIGTDGTMDTLLVSEYDREDEQISEKIKKADEELTELLSEKITETAFDLPITDEEGLRLVRNRETTAGDFAADAIRYVMETDAAMVGGGGVRKPIKTGDVTYGNLLDVFPFSNAVASVKCTGQQILDALEFGAKETQSITSFDGNPVGEFGGFMQVSGLKYTIDTSIESGVIVDENGMMTGIEGKRRVSDVMILKGGEYVPLDPAAEYTVASLDYALFNGGDGHTAFKDCERIVESGPMDVQSLIEYCRHLGTIPDSYRNTEGRITVK